MRIVDPEVIQREEKALIESIKSLFLFDVFHQECKDKYNIDLARLEELNSGDIVIEQDNVLFKLNALCKVGFAILIDREGNYMAFDFSTEPTEVADDANEKQTILSVPDTIRKKEEEIVRAISKEINTNNIEAVFENEFKAKLAGDIQSEGGKLTIYKSTLAYQLNYTASLNLNLHIDMAGNLIELNPSNSRLNEEKSYPEDTFKDSF